MFSDPGDIYYLPLPIFVFIQVLDLTLSAQPAPPGVIVLAQDWPHPQVCVTHASTAPVAPSRPHPWTVRRETTVPLVTTVQWVHLHRYLVQTAPTWQTDQQMCAIIVHLDITVQPGSHLTLVPQVSLDSVVVRKISNLVHIFHLENTRTT